MKNLRIFATLVNGDQLELSDCPTGRDLIKALLQYTAQQYKEYNATTHQSTPYSALRQGAGFLNTLGAVRLARFYTHPHAGDR